MLDLKKIFLIGGAGVTYTKNVEDVFLCIIGKEYWASEVCWKKKLNKNIFLSK